MTAKACQNDAELEAGDGFAHTCAVGWQGEPGHIAEKLYRDAAQSDGQDRSKVRVTRGSQKNFDTVFDHFLHQNASFGFVQCFADARSLVGYGPWALHIQREKAEFSFMTRIFRKGLDSDWTELRAKLLDIAARHDF